jgi:hypothetical protein
MDKRRKLLCQRWLNFLDFNADVGLRPQGHSLLSIDETKLLGPGNFVWTKERRRVRNPRDPLRSTFHSMWQRCSDPKHKDFHSYGGRGIKVCEAWKSFEQFRADMGVRPQGYSLERKDVNGNYDPENCCWIDSSVQTRNRRCTVYVWHCGMKLDLMTACQLTGKSSEAVRNKYLKKNRSIEDCFQATGKERADIRVKRLLRAESKDSETPEKRST